MAMNSYSEMKLSEAAFPVSATLLRRGSLPAARAGKQLQLFMIMKATRLCNLRCSYCNAWRDGPNQVMPQAIVTKATRGALELASVRRVDFVWHGGETTLLSPDYFYQALEIQTRYRADRIIKNTIQTNGTLLNDAWVSLFKEGKFCVGVSIDPPPERHARERRTNPDNARTRVR
jgi:uncharacterized protein